MRSKHNRLTTPNRQKRQLGKRKGVAKRTIKKVTKKGDTNYLSEAKRQLHNYLSTKKREAQKRDKQRAKRVTKKMRRGKKMADVLG